MNLKHLVLPENKEVHQKKKKKKTTMGACQRDTAVNLMEFQAKAGTFEQQVSISGKSRGCHSSTDMM